MRMAAATNRCSMAPTLPMVPTRSCSTSGDYFRRSGVTLPDPPFLDLVPIRFGVTGTSTITFRLLVSPYAYSTYRGKLAMRTKSSPEAR